MTSSNKSKERLLKLAWLLENLTTEFPQLKVRFDLGLWTAKYPSCHTVACACGWAGLHPWFRRRGFLASLKFGDVHYGDYSGFEAAGRFFGLDNPGWLFSDSNYPPGQRGRRDVSRRIRAYVKEHLE